MAVLCRAAGAFWLRFQVLVGFPSPWNVTTQRGRAWPGGIPPSQDSFRLRLSRCGVPRGRSVSPCVPLQAFHEEYSRLYLLAKETPTPQNDARLQHVLIYLLQNNAPQQVVERTLLEQFADKNLSYDERFVLPGPRWGFSHLEAARAIALIFSVSAHWGQVN